MTIEEPLYPDGGIRTINNFAAFPGTINGVPCHIMCKVSVDYDRRRVFVLAAERLRDKLNLVDGSEVDLQFNGGRTHESCDPGVHADPKRCTV